MKPSLKKCLTGLLFVSLCLISIASAIPSGGVYPPEFHYRNGYWYDSWGYNRNRFSGEDGFLPNVAYESLGSDKERAYEIGEWFEENYDNKVERAEAILNYVQQWTDYGYADDGNTKIRDTSKFDKEYVLIFHRPSNYTKVLFKDISGKRTYRLDEQEMEMEQLSDHDSCWRDSGWAFIDRLLVLGWDQFGRNEFIDFNIFNPVKILTDHSLECIDKDPLKSYYEKRHWKLLRN